MVLKPEQERVKTLLSDTVTLLCRNGLTYNKKFSITALIGITLDDDDVVLVEIKETVKNNVDEEEENSESESYQSKATSRKRKRKRRHSRQSSDSDNENGAKSDQEQNSVGSSFANPAGSDVKREQTVEDDSDEDLVFIKDEPGLSGGDMSNLYSQHNDSNQMYSSQQPPPGDILGNLGQQGQLYATPASSEHIGGPLPGPSTSWSDSSMSQQFPGGAGLHGNALSQQAVGSPMQGKSSQPTAEGRFPCHFCPLTFSTQMSQVRHENLLHYRRYPKHCSQCGKGCTGVAELNAHLASVHGQAQLKVQCPHCSRSFTRKNNMMAHIRNTHGGLGLNYDEGLDSSSSSSSMMLLSGNNGMMKDSTNGIAVENQDHQLSAAAASSAAASSAAASSAAASSSAVRVYASNKPLTSSASGPTPSASGLTSFISCPTPFASDSTSSASGPTSPASGLTASASIPPFASAPTPLASASKLCASDSMIDLFLKTLLGARETYQITISRTATIVDLKEEIMETIGYPVDQQCLMCGETLLEDGKTIADYGLKDGSILHHVWRTGRTR